MLKTGTKMLNVPYKGGGVALNDMMAGTTHVMFPQLPAVLGLAKSGQVRALAVTSRYRLSQLPDVPTLDETGFPAFTSRVGTCCSARAGCRAISARLLSDALVDAVRNDKTIRERMIAIGVEPVGEPSAKAEAFFDQELVRWKDVIDRAGIKLDK